MAQAQRLLRRMVALAVPLALLVVAAMPQMALAQKDDHTVVRVGWYDSSYNTVDSMGRRSGYAYEYQLKLAAYTGWSYEYVMGSWSELLQMLVDGRIDLMSDVSYTEERAEHMLYPDLPMGSEEYYLFVSTNNLDIISSDASTLDGKRVGVNKDSVQADFYRSWAERNGVEAEVVELISTEDESLQMLDDGVLDAYVTVDSFTDPKRAAPLFKVGSSDFFFAVSKKRPELLPELNDALARIQSDNHHFNQQMYDRYIKASGTSALLSADELGWLADHETIRVGYQDNYLAFCAKDAGTGQLTGALKDYLAYATDCLDNAELAFETTAYPTVDAAFEALRAGEVDCVFPASLSGYDGEKLGVTMTPPLMSTDVYAVVRQADMSNFTNREHVVVAVNHGNPNYDAFLADHFPSWQTVYYEDTAACLKAVADNLADCVLISSYRYNNVSRLCDEYNLTTFPTAVSLESCFAVAKGDTELYSILAKVTGQVPASTVNSALSYYITEDAKLTLGDFLADHAVAVVAGVVAVLVAFLLLTLRSMRAERRARELIAATENDALTGLYNRDYFLEYANRMHREKPDVTMDALVLNIEQFHSINELNGREFGDQVLRVLGNEIRLLATERDGIAGRFGADRFDVFCRHIDGGYQAVYDRLQAKLDELSPIAGIRLRMGVAPAQAGMEPIQLFDRAQTACTMARGHFKEHLVVFDEEVRRRERYEQRLLNDLGRALDSYEFEVHYQPKYDIQVDPPKLVSAEALIRWRHPELGMIAPGDFIPLFERKGKIEDVDKYAWSEAARQIARWRAQFGVLIPVSVNLSRIDVFDPKLKETLDAILKENSLPHDALKLEVTESAYMENADELIRVVERLRAAGYTVEMDDFGTGYSSLNMLSSIPIDVLKVDRAFISGIESDERVAQLVGLIVGIAKSMGVPVVAEGVETASQLELLKSLGCKVVQGFYFSRPLHPTDFESEYLRNAGR